VNQRILVVEDERDLAEALAARLRAMGFTVDVAHDGLAALDLARVHDPDLVVLDLMLPGLDGISVAKSLTNAGRSAILVLTARDAEADVLNGLAAGADDYLTKPFSMRIFAARVEALLRRVVRHAQPPVAAALINDRLVIDPTTRTVTWDGNETQLTRTEFEILHVMASVPGRVFTRDELVQALRPDRPGTEARTIDSHVRSLRQKTDPDMIRTAHGIGYALQRDADLRTS
jgi:DNA-binding response OmpR family regulator